MEFERWVSLGNFCLTKYQINRYIARNYFDLKTNSTLEADKLIKILPRDEVHAVNGGNLFFDWVVTYNYQKVVDLLRSGFDYSLQCETLEEQVGDGGKIENIICTKAGVKWVHLFSRENGLRDWREQVPQLRPKVAHLVSGFKELSHHTTLYIMSVSLKFVNGKLLDDIVAAIEALRGEGARDFRVLCCILDNEPPEDRGKIFFRRYDNTLDFPKYPHLGNAASWEAAFADFKLTPRGKTVDGKALLVT